MTGQDELLAQVKWAEEVFQAASRLESLRAGRALESEYFNWAQPLLTDTWEQTRAVDAIREDDPEATDVIAALQRAEATHGEFNLNSCRGLHGEWLVEIFGEDHWEDVEWAAVRRCRHDASRLEPPTPHDGRASEDLLQAVASTWRASTNVSEELLAEVSAARLRLNLVRQESGITLTKVSLEDDLSMLVAVVKDPAVDQTLQGVVSAHTACTPPPGVRFAGEFAQHRDAYTWFIDQARAALAAS